MSVIATVAELESLDGVPAEAATAREIPFAGPYRSLIEASPFVPPRGRRTGLRAHL